MPLFSVIAEQPCSVRWVRIEATRSVVPVGSPQPSWRSGQDVAVIRGPRGIMPEEE
jgi:hypothetical protein